MSKAKNHCYHCENRHIGCHSDCELYWEFRRQWDENKAKQDKERKAVQVVIERQARAKDIKNKVRKGRY